MAAKKDQVFTVGQNMIECALWTQNRELLPISIAMTLD